MERVQERNRSGTKGPSTSPKEPGIGGERVEGKQLLSLERGKTKGKGMSPHKALLKTKHPLPPTLAQGENTLSFLRVGLRAEGASSYSDSPDL